MRRLALMLMPLVAACQQEPSFDERYADTQDQIGDKAEELDNELQGAPDGNEMPSGDTGEEI